MREVDKLPKIKGEAKDYGIIGPIQGADYLTTPDDDLRWHVCHTDVHPSDIELPVVFFEIIAKRLSKTDDLSRFLRGISLPISIRRYFSGAESLGRLELYINELLLLFPAIISRAGYLLDIDALSEDFALDFEKSDLKSFYSKTIQDANSRDVPVIGAALSKLEGWDAPEKLQIAQVSEVRHILDSICNTSKILTDGGHSPLPPPLLEG